MKITTVIGARPQFIKASVLNREFRLVGIDERLLHTGQHYDKNMSDIFFSQLGIDQPQVNLSVNKSLHGEQTAQMIEGIEADFIDSRPDAVLVYGDTNSTLAASIAATKLHIPIIHVEAGLRSFDKKMPEEVNRILTDHCSSLLLSPSQTAVKNLSDEGITKGVHLVGDVMEVALKLHSGSASLDDVVCVGNDEWKRGNYFLATIHRAENTSSVEKLLGILDAFDALEFPVILPLHPRTKKILLDSGWQQSLGGVIFIEPQGYRAMLALIQGSSLVLTDSGGLQKEAAWSGVPCVTIRDSTEWVETLSLGINRLTEPNKGSIVEAASRMLKKKVPEDCYTTLSQGSQDMTSVIKKFLGGLNQ